MTDETQATLLRLKARLVEDYGAVAREHADIYFFELPYIAENEKQLAVYALDSIYAALATTDTLVAFRAYIQYKEYVAKLGGGYIKNITEEAAYIATRRLEDLLREKST